MFKYVKFAEVPVDDQDRALRFYKDTIGLKVAQDAKFQEGWRWIELEIPGSDTRLLFTKRKTDGPSNMVLITDDVDRVYRELSGKGVAFTKEPSDSPWSPGERFAQLQDSEGNNIVVSTS